MQGEIDAVNRQLAATEGDEGVTSLLAERNLLFAETSKVRAALDAARVKLAERESARERHVAEVRARADAQSKELEEKREELAKLEVSLAESESLVRGARKLSDARMRACSHPSKHGVAVWGDAFGFPKSPPSWMAQPGV